MQNSPGWVLWHGNHWLELSSSCPLEIWGMCYFAINLPHWYVLPAWCLQVGFKKNWQVVLKKVYSKKGNQAMCLFHSLDVPVIWLLGIRIFLSFNSLTADTSCQIGVCLDVLAHQLCFKRKLHKLLQCHLDRSFCNLGRQNELKNSLSLECTLSPRGIKNGLDESISVHETAAGE